MIRTFILILYCWGADPPTVRSKNHLSRAHTPGVRSPVVEAIATHGNPRLRKSPATWNRKRIRRGITQTTRRPPLSRNSTAPHDNEATTRTSMRAWSQSPAPLALLCRAKMSATPNQTESRAKNIIRATKEGTGAKNRTSTAQRWPATEEAATGKKPVWRFPYRNRQNRTRSPPHMNGRRKKRRKKRKVNAQYVLGNEAHKQVFFFFLFVTTFSSSSVCFFFLRLFFFLRKTTGVKRFFS